MPGRRRSSFTRRGPAAPRCSQTAAAPGPPLKTKVTGRDRLWSRSSFGSPSSSAVASCSSGRRALLEPSFSDRPLFSASLSSPGLVRPSRASPASPASRRRRRTRRPSACPPRPSGRGCRRWPCSAAGLPPTVTSPSVVTRRSAAGFSFSGFVALRRLALPGGWAVAAACRRRLGERRAAAKRQQAAERGARGGKRRRRRADLRRHASVPVVTVPPAGRIIGAGRGTSNARNTQRPRSGMSRRLAGDRSSSQAGEETYHTQAMITAWSGSRSHSSHRASRMSGIGSGTSPCRRWRGRRRPAARSGPSPPPGAAGGPAGPGRRGSRTRR